MDSSNVTQFFVIEAGELEEVERMAQQVDVEATLIETRGLEPVSTITLILIGAAAAVKGLIDVIEHRRGGQIVDLRPGASAIIYRSRNLQYGLIALISVDGTITITTTKGQRSIELLQKTLLGLASKSVGTKVGDLLKEIESATTNDDSVTVEVEHNETAE